MHQFLKDSARTMAEQGRGAAFAMATACWLAAEHSCDKPTRREVAIRFARDRTAWLRTPSLAG